MDAPELEHAPRPHARRGVPVAELIDLAALGPDPSRRALRAALPRGWVLEEDGATARRDLRAGFREGWILCAGLVAFGAAGIGLFAMSFPRGLEGWLYLLGLGLALLLAGGLVAPLVTRALTERRR